MAGRTVGIRCHVGRIMQRDRLGCMGAFPSIAMTIIARARCTDGMRGRRADQAAVGIMTGITARNCMNLAAAYKR